MTVRECLEDLATASIGYAVALAVVVVWPNAATPTAMFVAVLGWVVVPLVSVAVNRLVYRRSFARQFEFQHRPWRSSIPLAIAALIAFVFMESATFSGPLAPVPDDVVRWFAVAAPLLIGGLFLSNLLWALHSTKALDQSSPKARGSRPLTGPGLRLAADRRKRPSKNVLDADGRLASPTD